MKKVTLAQKDNPQGNASLAGAEFTWKYYAGFYNKDNLPAEATRTKRRCVRCAYWMFKGLNY